MPGLASLHVATLDDAAHLVQVALTPVFLLSGIAALLNVFAGRLARVADRLESLTSQIDGCSDKARKEIEAEIGNLHRRSIVLDTAVVLGAIGAGATCLAILTLFLQAISNRVIASFLVGFFGLAIVCTLCSVLVFGLEMLISSRAMRGRMRFHLPWRRHLVEPGA